MRSNGNLPGSDHGRGCGCNACIDALQNWVSETVSIDKQIEAVVYDISEYGLIELMPVLKTLQFVRDNQEAIRGLKKKPPN